MRGDRQEASAPVPRQHLLLPLGRRRAAQSRWARARGRGGVGGGAGAGVAEMQREQGGDRARHQTGRAWRPGPAPCQRVVSEPWVPICRMEIRAYGSPRSESPEGATGTLQGSAEGSLACNPVASPISITITASGRDAGKWEP